MKKLIGKYLPSYNFNTTVILLLVLLTSAVMAAPNTSFSNSETFPEKNLRGYGKVSGTFKSNSTGGSLLEINCENSEKSKLLQAKYWSDASVLGDIKESELALAKGKIPVLRSSAGSVAVARIGNVVSIFAAQNDTELSSLIDQSGLSEKADSFSKSTAEIPMWLNRWDKHGFNFYHREWEKPDKSSFDDYDVTQEFTYSRDHGKTGFIYWSFPNMNDTAEGMDLNTVWDWCQNWSKGLNLPVGINLYSENLAHVPKWIYDRHRNELMRKAPQFSGIFHGNPTSKDDGNSMGMIPWGLNDVRDELLGVMQVIVRKFNSDPNVIKWLEPHGELQHGDHDVLLDYGPTADATFHDFLKKKYKKLSNLGNAWQSDPKFYKTWEEVRLPEIAEFLGWGPHAIDLVGEWKFSYNENAPETWYKPDFDDKGWDSILAPGNDRILYIPRKSAVYRRTIDVDGSWLIKNPQVWLYVWDLNRTSKKQFLIYVNGKKVLDESINGLTLHWSAVDVSKLLVAGKNQISLGLPDGQIRYRVYLSPSAPKPYPYLGEGLNAQWVDFHAWRDATRLASVERGSEMIRQIDPNRPIDYMAPDNYASNMKVLAEKWGGIFKNTGYMGGVWADYLPGLMRSSGLPFALEPGGPAKDLEGFKNMMGLYYTEGLQGVDYYIHIGSVLWDPAIKQQYEKTLPLSLLFGKYHVPKADVAVLYSTESGRLNEWPWFKAHPWMGDSKALDANANLLTARTFLNIPAILVNQFPRDYLNESDFFTGNASKYKVIIDANTSAMDDKLLKAIEEYVKQGGIFVTFYQTGRHSPTEPDAWPISKLTGYKVVSMAKMEPNMSVAKDAWLSLKPAEGQVVFTKADWMQQDATGMRIAPELPDCKDLLLWDDGSVAVGMRQIGKGYIIQSGCRWFSGQMPDRIGKNGYTPQVNATVAYLSRILDWQKVQRIPAQISGDPQNMVIWRHYISNNSLYDIWTLFNQDPQETAQVDLTITENIPSEALEVENGKNLPVKNGKLEGIKLEPKQTRMFITPRKDSVAQSSREWFALQRDWWRATASVSSSKPFPAPTNHFSQPLNEDWSWQQVKEGDDPNSWAQPSFDSSKWEKMRVGIWDTPSRPDIKQGFMRKTFTVRDDWKKGTVYLWLQTWVQGADTINKQNIRIWFDGKLVKDWSLRTIQGSEMDGELTPGSTHTIAFEMKGKGTIHGLAGDCWLSFVPSPEKSIDLGGTWTPTADFIKYNGSVAIPGAFTNATGLRRTFNLPAELEGQNIMLAVNSAPNGTNILGALVNGRFIRRHHHRLGTRWDLNISPLLYYGKDNDIELVIDLTNPGKGAVDSVALNIYPKNVYP